MAAAHEFYDVIIVGGGPAGLSAALVLARCRRRILVIDAGLPRNQAARELHGYLTRDCTPPAELLESGRREIGRYGVEIRHDLVVEAECIAPSHDYAFPTLFLVRTKQGVALRCRKLLFATGITDTLPEIPGVVECYGTTVHHCPYCDGWEHRDQRLLAFGKNATAAAGLALALRTWSAHVTVLGHGQTPADHDMQRLARNGIDFRPERVVRLRHDGSQLRGAELDGDLFLPADALFFNTDCSTNLNVPQMLGCALSETGMARTTAKQRSNIAGVFLAGDADGEVQFSIVAAGEGATAAVTINRELQDEDRGD
ncbi:MAG TPA: NAD(P)/FAD-dependent oxidoreductase [Pirellulales bacterium]|nr:NAD(P)/FAD-dependent oxidoreductase [Pirellulales bacterium]